jgi:hypothetical protein
MMDIEALCRKLKPIIGNRAEELWYTWLASDLQERKDLEIEIQMIAEKVLKHGPLEDRIILLPPPSEEQANGDFILGNIIYRDKKLYPLCLKEEDFIKQIGIFSITGGGKTNVGMLLALQLLKKKIPFMAIDWKRQWRSILSLDDFPNIKDVQVYTIGRDIVPFSWNPFRPPPNIDYKTWISVIAECLEKSHLGGLGVADFFIRIYEELFQNRKDENYPNFYDGLRELQNIKVGGREFLWWQSAKRIFKSFTFGPASKSFNARKPIKLEELLEKPVILELDQEMPKPLRIFFQELVIRFIHLHRLAQGESESLRSVLFLEEIHNLFQTTKFEKGRMDSLENVYREIRSFGQGLVSITQHCSLLPVHILGNSHTLIFLALQHQDDIEAARKALFLLRDDEAYLNMLKTGQGIVKVMERVNPCLVQFLYVPVEKGMITDEWLKKRYDFSDFSGTNSTTFENSDDFSSGDKIEGVKSLKSVKELLIDILNYPLSSLVNRYKRLGINPRVGNEYKKIMISEGLVEPKRFITRETHILLFELTQKGKSALRELGYEVKNDNESLAHKFWKTKIADYYKTKGFTVLIEEHINGKPDVIVVNRGRQIAVEIETGSSDFIKNISRDLKAFDETICVATDKETEEEILQSLNENKLACDKLKLTSVLNFPIA